MNCATSTPAKRRRLSPPRRLDTSVDIHEYLSDISSGSENEYNSEHEESDEETDIIPIEEVDPISSASDESDAEEEEEGGDESVGYEGGGVWGYEVEGEVEEGEGYFLLYLDKCVVFFFLHLYLIMLLRY